MPTSIRTCLWFRDGRGLEAAAFYCTLIPGSRIDAIFDIGGVGASWLIDFTLGGVPYQILDAGPMFTLTEAVRFRLRRVIRQRPIGFGQR